MKRKAPLVYIAGPYSGPDFLTIDQNINVAREVAKWLCDNRIYFFCPHLNSAHFEAFTQVPKDYWLDLDLEIMYVCDALLILPGWLDSPGTMNEIRIATDRGIPVFYPHQHAELLAWRSQYLNA